MARKHIVAFCIFLPFAAVADDANPPPKAAPAPVGARFLKLDGPAATLRWQDRLRFRISNESFQALTIAARRGPLSLRVYSGTPDQLRRKQGRDPYDCISFFYLARPQIRLTRSLGGPTVETDAVVGRSWFDDSSDMQITVVIDEGKLPETFTRIHYTLVGGYFDSGMVVSVQARSADGELVNLGWKGPTAAPKKMALPGERAVPTVRPSPKETVYRGDLVGFVPGDFMQVRDLETGQVDRVSLAGHTIQMHDSGIKVGERVLAILIEDTMPRLSLWRSFYPECIRPANQTFLDQPDDTVVAMVQRCEIGSGSPLVASPQ